jgi:hypothetical protein
MYGQVESSHEHRDYRIVTCCSKIGGLYYHTANEMTTSWVADGDRSQSWVSYWLPPVNPLLGHDIPIVPLHKPYDESRCQSVWADAILFSEPFVPTGWEGPLGHISHYLMEFLSNLFFVVESRAESNLKSANSSHRRLQRKPLFIMRRYTRTQSPNSKWSFSPPPPLFHTALWPLLSDHEWIKWHDVLAMVHNPPGGDGPSYVCFRSIHVYGLEHDVVKQRSDGAILEEVPRESVGPSACPRSPHSSRGTAQLGSWAVALPTTTGLSPSKAAKPRRDCCYVASTRLSSALHDTGPALVVDGGVCSGASLGFDRNPQRRL